MHYEFSEDALTPKLLQAIGLTIVRWVRIETELDDIFRDFNISSSENNGVAQNFDSKASFIKKRSIKLFREHYSNSNLEIQILYCFFREIKNIIRFVILYATGRQQ